ncbi:MAG: PHP domain-containing protein [Oscillospiraceae bacterium]|nr:PHP domain-containing protein [Oscillospiraceae bacterium]
MKKIDLHMHTMISDGTDSLEEVIEKVRNAGIDLFSVTDHDAIKAGILLPPMLTEMDQRPAFIRGIEFSCKDEMGKYHILGYGYDPDVPGIAEVVEKGHGLRIRKTKERLQFLADEFGFEFPEEEIEALLARDNPGKPHIANMMIKRGYAGSIREAMSEYINKKKFGTAYIRPDEAIYGILQSGGIPVLAHPTYGDGDDLIMGEEMDERLQYLMDFGLMGVEGYYSGFSPKIQSEVLSFADRYELYVTAGSDYHGSNKIVELGWTNLDDMSEAPEGMKRFLQDVEII